MSLDRTELNCYYPQIEEHKQPLCLKWSFDLLGRTWNLQLMSFILTLMMSCEYSWIIKERTEL